MIQLDNATRAFQSRLGKQSVKSKPELWLLKYQQIYPLTIDSIERISGKLKSAINRVGAEPIMMRTKFRHYAQTKQRNWNTRVIILRKFRRAL